MKKIFQPNEGKIDRIIRIIAGLIFFGLGLSGMFKVVSAVFILIGIAGIFTSITGFCGLYKLLGINTCPIKKS